MLLRSLNHLPVGLRRNSLHFFKNTDKIIAVRIAAMMGDFRYGHGCGIEQKDGLANTCFMNVFGECFFDFFFKKRAKIRVAQVKAVCQ